MTIKIRKQAAPVMGRLSILLYGESKVGKTTAAAGFPNPIILACEPHGTDMLTNVDIVDVSSLDMLSAAVRELARLDEYTTIVLDGVTSLVNAEALRLASPDENGRQPRGEMVYREVTHKLQAALGILFSANKMIIATGHGRSSSIPGTVVKTRSGTVEQVEIAPDLNPALAQDVVGLFSVVCYCYPTQGNSQMITKPVDEGWRVIRAGDRSGSLPNPCPLTADAILNPLRRYYKEHAAKPQEKAEPEQEPKEDAEQA